MAQLQRAYCTEVDLRYNTYVLRWRLWSLSPLVFNN